MKILYKKDCLHNITLVIPLIKHLLIQHPSIYIFLFKWDVCISLCASRLISTGPEVND